MVELRTTFVLAEPPRRVPARLRVKLLFDGAGQLGWLIFGFGLIFVWVFGARPDLSFYRFWSGVETADGRVTQVTDTGITEGGDDHTPGRPVRAYDYAFVGPDGREYGGRSYTTSGRIDPNVQWVRIEFPQGDPRISRIQGMRRTILGPAGVLFYLFPAVGVVFIVWRIRSGLRTAALLRGGRLALGRVTAKAGTHTTANEKRVFRVSLNYQTEDGVPRTLTTRTADADKLGDDEQERVLYDPTNPARAVPFDTLPGSPQTDDQGQFRPAGARGLACFILPGVTLAGHGLYVYHLLTGWRPF